MILVRADNGCLEFAGAKDKDGYGKYFLGKKCFRAHRYAWEKENGKIKKGLCVLHKCDNPPCCNPDHLFLGTVKDNIADKVSKGRQKSAKGTERKSAKLTELMVKEIRVSDFSKWGSRSEMARKLGVSFSIISEILSGKRWNHV